MPDRVYYVEYAIVGKVLYSVQKQKISYWALGECDGGGVDTAFLETFFDYFDIDPLDYVEQAGDGQAS